MVSVILCTHNPRTDVLAKTLEGLMQQTLDSASWELLLIDNASQTPVEESIAPDTLARMRCIREDTIGLTAARLRGIRESKGDLLVFVDDDNVLAPDYLANAARIAREHTQVGAFGGTIKAVFEETPPEWTRPYWYLLAIRDTPEDRIAMSYGDAATEPCGAGLCVRREIAAEYARLLAEDPLRRGLDRTGSSLASAGDMDLVYTCFDMGFGIGRFKFLVLDHLIPPSRLEEDYFLRIFEAMVYTGTLLRLVRGYPVGSGKRSVRSILREWKRFVCSNSLDRRMAQKERLGKTRALMDWENRINS